MSLFILQIPFKDPQPFGWNRTALSLNTRTVPRLPCSVYAKLQALPVAGWSFICSSWPLGAPQTGFLFVTIITGSILTGLLNLCFLCKRQKRKNLETKWNHHGFYALLKNINCSPISYHLDGKKVEDKVQVLSSCRWQHKRPLRITVDSLLLLKTNLQLYFITQEFLQHLETATETEGSYFSDCLSFLDCFLTISTPSFPPKSILHPSCIDIPYFVMSVQWVACMQKITKTTNN